MTHIRNMFLRKKIFKTMNNTLCSVITRPMNRTWHTDYVRVHVPEWDGEDREGEGEGERESERGRKRARASERASEKEKDRVLKRF